jgi:hypothetical protein
MVLASLAQKIHTPLHVFFLSGEKTHADFAWFWRLWFKKSIDLYMFFLSGKKTCRFCIILASLALKIHLLLQFVFNCCLLTKPSIFQDSFHTCALRNVTG